MGEGAGGLAAMEAAFAARVACTTSWTMAFISTFGNDSEGGVGAYGEPVMWLQGQQKLVLRRRRARCGPIREGYIVIVRPVAT